MLGLLPPSLLRYRRVAQKKVLKFIFQGLFSRLQRSELLEPRELMLVNLGALLRLLVLLGHLVEFGEEIGGPVLLLRHLLLDRQHLAVAYLIHFNFSLFLLF